MCQRRDPGVKKTTSVSSDRVYEYKTPQPQRGNHNAEYTNPACFQAIACARLMTYRQNINTGRVQLIAVPRSAPP